MGPAQAARPVVVGVDGSEQALRAVRWAAAEAARRRAPLRLVSAFGWAEDGPGGGPARGRRYRGVLLDRARAHLAEAVTAATARAATAAEGGVEVESDLVAAAPIGALADESRRAQLMVLGAQGIGRIAAMISGSVTVAMVAHASCPVVVVRGPEIAGASVRPVVVGVDGSAVSEAALGFAFATAADRGVELVAVHTWFDPGPDLGVGVGDYRAEMREWAQATLAQRLAGWAQKYPEVTVTRVVQCDRPAHQLLTLSESAQLVVVGSRGHGQVMGTVLGSVSNALVHRAGCPVAVVRPDVQR
ncbi:universal stress protein [Actinomycetes bacterium KLBMP 9759]